MAHLAIVHPDLSQKGGAEAVCLNVLEALQHEHDLTLVTLTRPDIEALNMYFNTTVDPDLVRVDTSEGRLIKRVLNAVSTLPHMGNLHFLEMAVLNRIVRREESAFDVIVSTSGELQTSTRSIQYIHFPNYFRREVRDKIYSFTFANELYDHVATRLSGIEKTRLGEQILLTNSSWTASVVEDVYGVRPNVVYPPISTDQFDERSWEDREHGFLTIGRMSADKNIVRNIDIVGQLRDRGHDIHLHVIGSVPDKTEFGRVQAAADTRPYVSIHSDVYYEQLIEFISSHRYGLHGKEHEHFGMAVAELIAGGCLPFVPDTGGQVELVNGTESLTYSTIEEAVENIDTVLTRRDQGMDIRHRLPDVDTAFGRDRFREEIQAVVKRTLQ